MEFRKKKQKKVEPSSPNRNEEGDAWIYTSLKRNSYFLISFSVGKWTQATCEKMIKQLFDRMELPSPDNKIEIFTDGNDDYTYILPKYFASTCVDYGQLVKIREKGRVVEKLKRAIYGQPVLDDIETTDVENYNGILRERVGRLVRKTKCFSKRKNRLEGVLHIFQFYWNFMNNFRRYQSPAMIEGIAKKQWTWKDFLSYSFAV